MKSSIILNAQIKTSSKISSPANHIHANVAGLPFTIYFNADAFEGEGTCTECRNEFSCFKKGMKTGSDFGHSYNELRIEEIQFKYKGYTAETVKTANKFVKKLFGCFIKAMQKQFGKKVLCHKCYEKLMAQDIVLLGLGKSSYEEVLEARVQIEHLW